MSGTSKACWRWKRQVSLYASDELVGESVPRLEAHLAVCPDCRARLAELRRLDEQLRVLGEQLPSDDAPLNLRERWQAAIVGVQARSCELRALGSGWGGLEGLSADYQLYCAVGGFDGDFVADQLFSPIRINKRRILFLK